ncbi:hypothetical protein GUJ93_ZPchr0008g11513 [Zizania palustris]|uniref:Uncharacterized protein n=1 Tax=Zizania palustris TaxID=103762 RepID=A0A8J5RF88_ZIZPA|nr:hypothetical protein GUJ93_ZPchr0008g11513 [Zizania palustris]
MTLLETVQDRIFCVSVNLKMLLKSMIHVDMSYGKNISTRPRTGDSEIPISSKLGSYSSTQQCFKADLSCTWMLNNSTVNALPLVTKQFVSSIKMEVPERRTKAPDAMEMKNNTVDTFSKEQAHCHLEISMNSKKIKGASHYECDPPLHANVNCQFPGMQQASLHLCMLALQ